MCNKPKHHKLAEEAIKASAPFSHAVSEEVSFRLQLAYVADWLAKQDVSIQATAAQTAVAAIDWMRLCRENSRQ